MDIEKEVNRLIESKEQEKAIQLLESCPDVVSNEALLLQLGELLYSDGKMTEALNKFNAVVRMNPENKKAINYVTMILNIINYYNKDLLNP